MRAGGGMAIRGMLVLGAYVWSGHPCPRSLWRRRQAGRSARSTRSILALRRYWYPRSFGSSARHGCDACALSLRGSLPRCGCRLCWSGRRNQSQCLAHFGIELGHGVFVVLEELACVFAALADALALVTKPGAGFFEEVIVHRDVKQVAFAGNAFSIENVELGLAERRCHFVLYYFYAGARAGDYVTFLDGGDAPDIDAHRRVKLQRAATGCGFRIAKHHADFFSYLIDEDQAGARLGNRPGQLAQRLR